MGGVFTKLIERNTTIPTRKSEVFSTASTTSLRSRSRCTRVKRAMARDNRLLGVFQLGNIPPAPRGLPQIEVTFDIDANGILNVTAKDRGTNNEQKITITSSSGLSKEEVDKMAKDAESHAADDRKQRDKEPSRPATRADAMVYNVEKTLRSIGPRSATPKPRKSRRRSKRPRRWSMRTIPRLSTQRSTGSPLPATNWRRQCTKRRRPRALVPRATADRVPPMAAHPMREVR
jgi:molecular chaperone DnaK